MFCIFRLVHEGHYADRFFTRILLADKLLKLRVHLTGSIMPNRKFCQLDLKYLNLRKNLLAYKKKNMLVLEKQTSCNFPEYLRCSNSHIRYRESMRWWYKVVQGGKEARYPYKLDKSESSKLG